MRPRTLALGAVALVAIAGLAAALLMRARDVDAPGEDAARVATAGAEVTYAEHIAPILHANCVVCHRPGESAPFTLLDYDDARKRAGLIAAVTKSRFMPPWLPRRDKGRFLGERGLEEEEIELIQRWVAAGAPQGDPALTPKLPEFSEGWQLGEPDLVVEMTEPYTVPAEGIDVFRNFVIPVPVKRPRWVRAVELRPGNPRVVHHAVMQVDRSNVSRLRDAEDAELGFPGMEMGGSESPGGQLVGWTPGKVALSDERLAWQLDAGTDIVLQLHMLPSGKPEQVRPRIGLYFTDEAPDEQAFSLVLRNDDIDIPAGESDYVVEDSVTLPVPVRAVGIYPHAHYLGKSVQGWATLPDGTRRWLIDIPRWDFNWQDDYRYREPVHLPAGTEITMRYAFDNSSANPLNPNNPPKRVTFGNRSEDEMATLTIQVLPDDPEHEHVLREAVMRSRIRRDPDNWYAHSVLGASLRSQGRYDEALEHLDTAIRLHPGHPGPRYNLANALLAMGRLPEAVRHYQQVLEIDPTHAKAHNNLAIAYQQAGELERAAEHFRAQLEVSPDDARAHANLGLALLALGRLDEAEASFDEALARDPESVQALEGLGDVARLGGDPDTAADRYAAALAIDAHSAPAHYGLGSIALARRDRDAAVAHLERALGNDPAYVGRINDEAWYLATLREPGDGGAERALVLADLANASTDYAVPELLDTLAAAQAANGAFAAAASTMEKAISLAAGGPAAGYREQFESRLALYRRGKRYTE
ncbi:MAG: tetratricopeptide repeat protein [Gammaproteobacteria bacterium]|nr:tetratricopeptide repeat protein [Gammaproteobacteria bacterium]